MTQGRLSRPKGVPTPLPRLGSERHGSAAPFVCRHVRWEAWLSLPSMSLHTLQVADGASFAFTQKACALSSRCASSALAPAVSRWQPSTFRLQQDGKGKMDRGGESAGVPS